MARRKSYDDEFRAGALIMLSGAGYPNTVGALQRVADHLRVPTRTLRRWYIGQQNPPPDKMVATLKRGLVDILDNIISGVAVEVERRIENDEIADVSLPHLMTAFGIAVDKKQLLTGQPTAINEERASDARSKLADLVTRRATSGRDSGDTEYVQ